MADAGSILNTQAIGSSLGKAANSAMNVFYIGGIIFAFIVLIGIGILGLYIFNKTVLSYKKKAYLNYEIGQTVQKKIDFFKIDDKTGYPKFRSDRDLIAAVPDDTYSFFDNKRKKSFEGFVRNNQVAWMDPKPMVGLVEELRKYIDEDGEHVISFQRPVHRVIDTDSAQVFSNIIKKVYEAKSIMKWYQNPAVWGLGAMGILLFGIFLLFLMNQNTAKLMESVADKTFSLAQAQMGQVVK
jgi:hypothetical protein